MRSRAIHSVLAATDLTAASDEVLRSAASLARSAGAQLHVVHAFDFEAHSREPSAPHGFPDRVREAERALDDQVRRAIPAGYPVASREVKIYIAHREILDRAAQVSADLIVVGPHRRRPLMDRVLGSTARRVVRGAKAPCLVVRAPIAPPLHRLVVATNLSETARRALDEAVLWAREFGAEPGSGGGAAELRVLHVGSEAGATPEPALAGEVRAALDRGGGAGETRVEEVEVRGASPGDEIVRYAGRVAADLLVLGTSGHGAIRHALRGSVVATVSRLAPCSVLFVPPPATEKDLRLGEPAAASLGLPR